MPLAVVLEALVVVVVVVAALVVAVLVALTADAAHLTKHH